MGLFDISCVTRAQHGRTYTLEGVIVGCIVFALTWGCSSCGLVGERKSIEVFAETARKFRDGDLKKGPCENTLSWLSPGVCIGRRNFGPAWR